MTFRAPPGVAVLPDAAAVASAAARHVADQAATAQRARGAFRLGLSGGRIAEALGRALAAPDAGVDWSRVELLFADERAVPPDHPDSNYRLIHDALLRHVPLPPASVHRMRGEEADLDAAARDYEAEVARPIDLLLLGMGPDGHTASLFPRQPALEEQVRRVVAVRDAPKPPPARLSLTPRAIREARAVIVLVTGGEKAEMVRRALDVQTDARDVPARMLLERDWLLDREAASALK